MRDSKVLRLAAVAGAVLLFTGSSAVATELDLQANVSGFLGGAFFTRDATHTSGTGVVDPFLTIERAGNSTTEQGYNTSGGLVLDTQRPAWNRNLQLGQLQRFNIDGVEYFKFILDANEPGAANKVLISIDNIRIYTSATGSQTLSDPDALGTLRYSLNDPLRIAGDFNVDNWVRLSSDVSGGPGSGFGDMAVFIPTANFANVALDEYVYFYNLNGVHYSVNGSLGAQAGFEEWWAATAPPTNVPDGGSTLLLLGAAVSALGFVARRRQAK